LLLLALRDPARVAIERTMSLAVTRGAVVNVVAILRDGWRRDDHRPTVLGRFALALGRVTGHVRHVEVRRGSIRTNAISAGRSWKPDLVVLAADPDYSRTAAAIAGRLQVPVLVARDPSAAELIVVGYRRRSWLSRLVRGPLHDGIVARAGRSVLVVPLDP
jgi:nucleotide-binding universal stress UspA family protein